jgi:ribulose-bisphosphate carboxylase small chain
MRVTQGTFSYLPDFTDTEIAAQVDYARQSGWAVSVEFTDDPHPRNAYWDMWGLPMFDAPDSAAVLSEIAECRRNYPEHYIRINAYDASHGRQTIGLQFLVARPSAEPGFRLDRSEGADRRLSYRLHPYAADRPAGQRYQPDRG